MAINTDAAGLGGACVEGPMVHREDLIRFLKHFLDQEQRPFADPSHRMGRPVKTTAILVPNQIQAEGDRLTWTNEVPPFNWVTPGTRMISDFVKLASANSPEPYVKFAKRYGVFHAEQLLPDEPETIDSIDFGDKRWRVSRRLTWEPIEFWRELSRHVRAALRIAAELNKFPPGSGDEEDWRVLYDDDAPHLDDGRFWLELHVNHWLSLGQVRLRLRAQTRFPKPYQRERKAAWETEVICGPYGWYSSLFGMIALQLMLLIAGSEGLYTCTGCGVPYIPAGRRPRRGQNSYCVDCGLERARQDADRRRKDKMIEARRLHAEGALPEVIANRLNVRSVASVRRWLKKGRSNGEKTRKQ